MAGPAEAASTSFASSGAGVAAGIGGGLLSSLAGAGLSFGLNAKAASKSWDRQKNLMTRGPSYIAQGLEAAGINRILAAGSIGTSFGKAAQAAGTSVQAADVSRSGALAAQIGQIKASTAAQLATADNQRAQARITAAGQSAADWNNIFNQTDIGKALLKTDRINRALPQNMGAMGARGLYDMFQGNEMSPGGKRWPIRIYDPKKPKGTK